MERPATKTRPARRPRLRLAVFDLDGTLKVRASPWRLLHEALGVWGLAASYRERFLAGAIDYHEWAQLDAALWRGTELSFVDSLFARSPYRPGVHDLFHFLRDAAVRTAVISTGLDVQARRVADDLGIWRTVTNHLVTSDGRLTGEVQVHVTETNKGSIMDQLCSELAIRGSECLAVGDGLADVALFARAGLSVAAYPLDDRVRSAAHVVVQEGSLAVLIPIIRAHFSPFKSPKRVLRD